MMSAIWRQAERTPFCPDTPRLDGKLALVTGGNGGIGLEISRGLARRGAEVIIAARDETRAESACRTISEEEGARVSFLLLDLSDLNSVAAATDRLEANRPGQTVDVLVANAGIWPKRHARSAQGHEIAFATNVLGHHVLVRRMIDKAFLTASRVIVLTGDIYIMVDECTSDFRYEGVGGARRAYCRSKLGNLWQVRELQRRYPPLNAYCVHPGVVATNLGGRSDGAGNWFQRAFFLSPVQGAQTSLFCATQPDITRGGYYHNTQGLMELADNDPAADADKAQDLWERLETLASAFL